MVADCLHHIKSLLRLTWSTILQMCVFKAISTQRRRKDYSVLLSDRWASEGLTKKLLAHNDFPKFAEKRFHYSYSKAPDTNITRSIDDCTCFESLLYICTSYLHAACPWQP